MEKDLRWGFFSTLRASTYRLNLMDSEDQILIPKTLNCIFCLIIDYLKTLFG